MRLRNVSTRGILRSVSQHRRGYDMKTSAKALLAIAALAATSPAFGDYEPRTMPVTLACTTSYGDQGEPDRPNPRYFTRATIIVLSGTLPAGSKVHMVLRANQPKPGEPNPSNQNFVEGKTLMKGQSDLAPFSIPAKYDSCVATPTVSVAAPARPNTPPPGIRPRN